MTGQEFETAFCKWLRGRNFWALNIPKNKAGAQPFDIIAVDEMGILAVDCKVCVEPRIRLSRIEDNQWTALRDIKIKGGDSVYSCIVCYHKGDMFLISLETLERARAAGKKSVRFELDREAKGFNYIGTLED